jgi:ATP-dependent DNA helicase RecG
VDASKLRKLLRQREGPKLDFKLEMPLITESHKKEITKDVIALANSPGGRGYLIVGIKDSTKEVVGVNPSDYPEEKIQQIILNRCDPPLSLVVDFVNLHDRTVVVITVYKSHNRPHQMRQTGGFYIRRGSTTDIARRDEVALMLQHGGLLFAEMMPVFNARMTHFDKDRLQAYVYRVTGQRYSDSDGILLSDLGLMFYEQEDNHFYPTLGALLLFGRDPQVLLPHTGIKIVTREADNQRIQVRLKGTIISLLDQSMAFLQERLSEIDYPLEVLEEAISNALVHRDYFDVSREVIIYVGEKHIEITNPGAIFDRDPLNNVIRSSAPKRRNPWLYHHLLAIDEKARFTKYGLGLLKIKRTTAPYGGVKYLNLKKSNLFKIVLPGMDIGKKNKGH